jgi:uncharacterized protein YkwD
MTSAATIHLRILPAATLLIALAALSACSTGFQQPVTPIPIDAAGAARLISAYRAENGLGPVGVDSRLVQAAARYARAMGERDRINHRIGGSLPSRVSAAGYDWGAVAENLGAGYAGLNDAITGWKRSPGHRKNLLSPYATEIGIAAVATPAGSKRRNYWALILAMPRPQPVTSGPIAMVPVQ